MCHRGRDWSRTASRASEPEDEPKNEREWWGVRAKERFLTFVSMGETDPAPEETPERPASDPTATEVPEETEETEEEREDPIPADD